MRFPVEVVRRIREALGDGLPDDVPDVAARPGPRRPDLGRDRRRWRTQIEEAGASTWSTPASAGTRRGCRRSSPRSRAAAWAATTARLRPELGIPVCASNRINTPEVAEEILASGGADLVSMARPFLADPEFVAKAAAGRADEINTCIGCNQACLDHTFANQRASCLVNPRACHETTLVLAPTRPRRRVAVVGAGPAGLATAVAAAERGHDVTLFEASAALGGQFRLAMAIPGKEEFASTLRYYARRLEVLGVDVRLSTRATVADLASYDEVVVATGVVPRGPRRSRAPTTRRWCPTPTRSPAPCRSARGSRWSAPAASASTSVVFLTHDATGGRSTSGWRTGASATRRCTPAG